MDIGTEKPMIVIEPVEDPVPGRENVPAPEPPETPVVVPEKEKVPA